MTDFLSRHKSNPINPGQAFPLEAIKRQKRAKLARAMREFKELRKENPLQELSPGNRDEATELKIFLDNFEPLYRQQGLPIIKNLVRKMARGIYDSDKALKLYQYYTDNAARAYGKEHMGSEHEGIQLFSPKVRKAIARVLVNEFESEFRTGNYTEYIPKKYRGNVAHENLFGHSHRGMQQTEYCPKCKRYLTREDLP